MAIKGLTHVDKKESIEPILRFSFVPDEASGFPCLWLESCVGTGSPPVSCSPPPEEPKENPASYSF
jgi:hypothetical protein